MMFLFRMLTAEQSRVVEHITPMFPQYSRQVKLLSYYLGDHEFTRAKLGIFEI